MWMEALRRLDPGDCILKYSPGTAQTGTLTVEYRIE